MNHIIIIKCKQKNVLFKKKDKLESKTYPTNANMNKSENINSFDDVSSSDKPLNYITCGYI